MAEDYVKPLEELTDEQLTQLVKQGDELAFEEITIRYLYLINTLAKQYYTSGYDINDFTQEGLLGLLSACKSYNENGTASLKSYITVCIRNVFVSLVRKNGTQKEIPESQLVSIDEIDASAFNDENADPEKLLLNKEHLNGLLSQLKNNLSQMEWNVLTLYIAGYSYSEIAKALDVTLKSVDNALQRIKKKRNTAYVPIVNDGANPSGIK